MEEKGDYFVIQSWMVTELQLSGNELLLYAVIYGFSRDGKSRYYGGTDYLCKRTGCSRRSVLENLKKLTEKGLLNKSSEIRKNVVYTAYEVVQNPHQCEKCTSAEIAQEVVQNPRRGSAESAPNNKDIYKKDNKDKPPIVPHVEKQDKKNKQAYPDEFEQAFSLYPKRPGANKPSAFKAWKARINDGVTPDELIDGVMRYAHYVGATGVHPQYIKQPSTFFGPDEHYLSDWRPPEKTKQCATSDWLSKLNESRGDYNHDNNIIDINTLAH